MADPTTPAETARRANGRTMATIVGLVASGAGAIAAGRWLRRRNAARPRAGEHPAPDLSADSRPSASDRAPVDFRPDPTAPVPKSERDALAPATGPSPTLVNSRGATRSEPLTSA